MPLFTIPAEEELNPEELIKVLIIRTNGTEETYQIKRKELFEKIDRFLNAQMLDHVKLGRKKIMWVDDAGYAKNLPVNHLATKMYWKVCMPGTTFQILGDVAITEGD